MGNVEIEDLGSVRKVRIRGEVYGYEGYSPNGAEFDTTYSVWLLRDLERVKGSAWLKDEIDRTECAEYVEVPLTRFIKRFCQNTEGLNVLDIGCGTGASSIVLARMGFQVVGIEPEERLVEVARLRVKESGLVPRVELRRMDRRTNGLPFDQESFDTVVMNAVIEHVPPESRAELLRESWRALRKGGFLFIHDTPNRLWPYDGHTTGLWFATWLPFRVAAAYARRCSRRIPPTTSDEDLIAKGLQAPTYWEVIRHLPDAECLNIRIGNDVVFGFGLTVARPRSVAKGAVRTCVIELLRAAGWVVNHLLYLPRTAILQNLNLCFRKPETV